MYKKNNFKKYSFKKIMFGIYLHVFLKMKIILYKNVLSNCNVIFINSLINQPTQFVGNGIIELDQASIGVWPSPNLFNGVSYLEARSNNSRIKIGKGSFINNSATIIADKTSITIGENCLIGPNVWITDSDFHGVNLSERRGGRYECKPVVIGNNVFLGEGVKILKGVHIGEGAVVGSGSIVTKDVDKFTLVAGVPAKKIKNIS